MKVFHLSIFLTVFIFIFSSIYSEDCQRVYLATFPRSGNHWIRYLIEEATGIVTFSVYRDMDEPEHLADPFPFGGYAPDHGYEGNRTYPTNTDITVIKTHYPTNEAVSFDCKPYIKTICVVRNPIDSFYSWFVYMNKSNPQEKMPRDMIVMCNESWKRFYNYWLMQDNTLMIRYEDILNDPRKILKQMLDEIGYLVSEEDIERAVNRYPPINLELKHINRYEKEDLLLIQQELSPFLDKFEYNINLN